MKLSEISPFVRYAKIQSDFKIFRNTLFPCDNRLFYCLDGSGKIEINNEVYNIEKDMVIMWRSGVSYRYVVEEEPAYSFVTINFDFASNDSKITSPLFPLVINSFSPDRMTERVVIDDVPGFEKVYVRKNAVTLRDSFESIVEEYNSNRLFSTLKCTAKLTDILAELARMSMSASESGTVNTIDSILNYIKKHCEQDISNEMLGKKYGYHPNYISSLMVLHTGLPLHKYLLMCRINKAGEMLRETNDSVSEIAEKCGFSSSAYFSRYFKKITGISPSDFKRS